MGITEEEKKGREEIFETLMTKNLPKLKFNTKPQVQEPQRTPSRINVQTSTPWPIIFKQENQR